MASRYNPAPVSKWRRPGLIEWDRCSLVACGYRRASELMKDLSWNSLGGDIKESSLNNPLFIIGKKLRNKPHRIMSNRQSNSIYGNWMGSHQNLLSARCRKDLDGDHNIEMLVFWIRAKTKNNIQQEFFKWWELCWDKTHHPQWLKAGKLNQQTALFV